MTSLVKPRQPHLWTSGPAQPCRRLLQGNRAACIPPTVTAFVWPLITASNHPDGHQQTEPEVLTSRPQVEHSPAGALCSANALPAAPPGAAAVGTSNLSSCFTTLKSRWAAKVWVRLGATRNPKNPKATATICRQEQLHLVSKVWHRNSAAQLCLKESQ